MERVQSSAGGFSWPDRQAIRLLTRLIGAAAIAGIGFGAFAAYEGLVLGLAPLGEMPPIFDLFHWSKMAFSMLASALIVAAIYSERAVAHGFDREFLPAAGRSAVAAIAGVAIGSTALFLVDPVLFNATAQEDLAVEWISTLLLLAASLVFLRAVLR